MRSTGRYIALTAAALAVLAWLDWPRLAGTPAWLNHIGLIPWLKAASPLDQWFAAVGTVSTLMYAIFSETFLSWWRRPRLEVFFEPRQPFLIEIPVLRGPMGNRSLQVRLLVRNEGGTRAEAVAIYARRLFRREGSVVVELPWFIPMDLKWAEDERPMTAISPGVERTCNLLGIEEPGRTVSPGLPAPQAPDGFDFLRSCFVKVQTAGDPTNLSNYVFPGSYRLELVVSAANARSRIIALDFWFDGRFLASLADMVPGAASFSITLDPPESSS